MSFRRYRNGRTCFQPRVAVRRFSRLPNSSSRSIGKASPTRRAFWAQPQSGSATEREEAGSKARSERTFRGRRGYGVTIITGSGADYTNGHRWSAVALGIASCSVFAEIAAATHSETGKSLSLVIFEAPIHAFRYRFDSPWVGAADGACVGGPWTARRERLRRGGPLPPIEYFS